MNRLLTLAAAAALTVPMMALAQDDVPAEAEVPVRRVTLFTSGVGTFTHGGEIDGDASATLRFPADQVNDLLKSLILSDAGGQVGPVTFPSADPLGKTLGSFRLDLRGEPNLAAILRQLRGAEVTVKLTGEEINGTVLGVEIQTKPVDDEAVDVTILNLFTGTSLRSVDVGEVRGIEIADEQLRQDLERALAAVAEARDADKKAITLNFNGDGQRQVVFGYVVAQPIWKTSYRLVLGQGDGDDAAAVQGWAVVENQTDFDWDNVQLSLVSGRPVSFEMDLYAPLYVDRPNVDVPVYAAVVPQSYAGGIEEKEPMQLKRRAARMSGMLSEDLADEAADLSMSAPAPASAAFDPTAGVAAAASGGEAGALFEYTVPSVKLPRQSGAMIPIIIGQVTAEPLSIFNAAVLADHPLLGAKLTNDTDSHLPPGPVTVYDGSDYQGDAQLVDTPPGGNRMLSFGVDQEIKADVEQTGDQTLTAAKIVKGTLELTRLQQQTTTYKLDSSASDDKTVVIEHPRRQGWELADTPDPDETTADLHRFRVELPAGELGEFKVTQQTTTRQQIALLGRDVGSLISLTRTGQLDDEVRKALRQIIQEKQALETLRQQEQQAAGQINEIAQEQQRIRQNMESVNRQGDYYNRLLTKLNEQETQIEALQEQRLELQQQINAAEQKLDESIRTLNVGR